MNRRYLILALMLTALAACSRQNQEQQQASETGTVPTAADLAENPFMKASTTPFGTPDFPKIREEHYLPAFEEGMRQQMAEIEAITANQAAPTFENTVETLEASGPMLDRVANVFFNLLGSEKTEGLQGIAEEVSPKLSQHGDDIALNPDLFARVKAVYDQRGQLQLSPEQARLLERQYKNFVRGGANLDEAQKERLREINKQLSLNQLRFGDNLLKENKAFQLVLDNEADLAGLPADVVEGAAEMANALGQPGKWVFTLDKPSMIPFLKYSDRRELREQLYKAYINRADNDNEQDNKQIVSQTAALRSERARLLGYDSHAHFVLEENMAKTPDKVYELLNQLWQPALARAREERTEMQEMIDSGSALFQLESWDWWYYAEKLRKAKYDLNEEEAKPYFSLDNVIGGAFMVANKLFGITFEPRTDIPTYHQEVRTYEVKDAKGAHVGIFYADYHPRPGKRGGAWMSSFRKQSRRGGQAVSPLIVNVCNFSRPVGNQPALLTFEEVNTLFHEFGHALHGLLSNCDYDSMSGTAVPRDFVEFPAQLYEHWAAEPSVMKEFAKHHKTGEPIPDPLIKKIKEAGKFNQGFATTEYLAASLLDMAWHTITDGKERDAREFENKILNDIGLIPEIVSRYRSTYFAHIFAGGYSSGYYAYIWSEVLDSDGFQAFKEKGVYDKATAERLLANVYSAGASADPMELYVRFRGKEPTIDALLEGRGLN